MNTPEEVYAHYEDLFKKLFGAAFKKDVLNFIATILRFDGMFIGHWDPLEEAKDSFRDFPTILEEAQGNGNRKQEIKISLLMYCHSIEMTEVQNVLANLLRVLSGKPFKMRPLWNEEFMKKRKKSKEIFFQPPGLTSKFKQLKKMASDAGENNLTDALNEIFNSDLRNSFSHSDYCIDLKKEKYRFREGGPGRELDLSYVEEVMVKAFAFYDAFFTVWEASLHQITGLPHYLKTTDYDILELLVENGRLYGFALHHSDDTKSVFERHPESVNCQNFFFTDEGFGIAMGDTAKFRKGWYLEGEEVIDFKKLNEDRPLAKINSKDAS
ncbi:MAG: hypothetical protein WC777_06070 [Candidatus Gracilibacteria bacterium]